MTSPALSCAADCNGDTEVTIDEIVLAVRIAIAEAPLDECMQADRDGSGEVTIDEIISAVSAATGGC